MTVQDIINYEKKKVLKKVSMRAYNKAFGRHERKVVTFLGRSKNISKLK